MWKRNNALTEKAACELRVNGAFGGPNQKQYGKRAIRVQFKTLDFGMDPASPHALLG